MVCSRVNIFLFICVDNVKGGMADSIVGRLKQNGYGLCASLWHINGW